MATIPSKNPYKNSSSFEPADPVTSETALDTTASTLVSETTLPLDREWARTAFMIGADAYDVNDQKTIRNRYWSTVTLKFTDTSIGGNIGMNPKPQFCPYSDIVGTDRLGNRQEVYPETSVGNYGMGRYYSEAIDTPAQRVYFRMGFPQFTGLLSFLTRAYDAQMTEMAKTGRGKGIFYTIPKAFGLYMGIRAFPPLAVLSLGVQALGLLTSSPSSKFYTMKPAMHAYWSAVNNLVFAWMINRGVFPKILDKNENQRLGMPFTIDQDHMAELREMMPEIFLGDSNYVDVFSVASRAQRIANHVFLKEFERLDSGDLTALDGFLEKRTETIRTYIGHTNSEANPTEKQDFTINLGAWINRFLSFERWLPRSKVDPDGKQTPGEVENDARSPTDGIPSAEKETYSSKLRTALDAQFRQGSEFFCLIVDATSSPSESWSNSYAEPQISQSLNSSVAQVRDMRFSMADGNLLGGVIGDAVGAVAGAAKNAVEGTISGLTLGVYDLVKGLAGSGFIDIPKSYQSSQVQLTTGQYKVKLISPEPDVYSQLKEIYMPLFCILAMVMPLSIGKSAYAGPMLCEVYDRGHFQSKLCAVTGVSVTRGTATLPFNIMGQALAIDVSITVTDLSSIMHMPLSASGISQHIESTMDEDNLLMDYLAVLAGQDIYSQIYYLPKKMIQLAKMTVGLQSMFSPYRQASAFADNSIIAGFIQMFVAGSSSVAGSTQPGR